MYQHNEISIVQTINNSKIRMYTEIDAENIYTVKRINSLSILFEVTLGKLIFVMSAPNFNIYYDSDDNSTSDRNLFSRMLSKLYGCKFNIEMTPSGTITSTNFSEIVTPIVSSLISSMGTDITQNDIDDYIKRFNNLSPSKNLQRLTNFLPTDKVNVGDKWISSGDIELGIPVKYDREVEFKSISDSCIVLESSSEINTYEIEKSKIMNDDTRFNLTGSEHFKIVYQNRVNGSTN